MGLQKVHFRVALDGFVLMLLLCRVSAISPAYRKSQRTIVQPWGKPTSLQYLHVLDKSPSRFTFLLHSTLKLSCFMLYDLGEPDGTGMFSLLLSDQCDAEIGL